jgi:hypothetical protein
MPLPIGQLEERLAFLEGFDPCALASYLVLLQPRTTLSSQSIEELTKQRAAKAAKPTAKVMSAAGKRIALLIGNRDYKPGVGALINPLNDIRLVG